MTTQLCDLFAKKFIARPDVKAIQHRDGTWSPHTDTGKYNGNRIGWRRQDLEAHIAGTETFGHYLLSAEGKTKLFAFDLDLAKTGSLPVSGIEAPDGIDYEECGDLRSAWLNRAHPARWYMKLQFKELAHKLAASVVKDLELPCAVAYSGSKGVHVYAFTGPISGKDAREGAKIVLDTIGNFQSIKGEHVFAHEGYPNLTVEVFPKQDDLNGKDLGNLMRLPLGKNQKNVNDPTFFIDMRAPLGSMVPRDAVQALTVQNPWED